MADAGAPAAQRLTDNQLRIFFFLYNDDESEEVRSFLDNHEDQIIAWAVKTTQKKFLRSEFIDSDELKNKVAREAMRAENAEVMQIILAKSFRGKTTIINELLVHPNMKFVAACRVRDYLSSNGFRAREFLAAMKDTRFANDNVQIMRSLTTLERSDLTVDSKNDTLLEAIKADAPNCFRDIAMNLSVAHLNSLVFHSAWTSAKSTRFVLVLEEVYKYNSAEESAEKTAYLQLLRSLPVHSIINNAVKHNNEQFILMYKKRRASEDWPSLLTKDVVKIFYASVFLYAKNDDERTRWLDVGEKYLGMPTLADVFASETADYFLPAGYDSYVFIARKLNRALDRLPSVISLPVDTGMYRIFGGVEILAGIDRDAGEAYVGRAACMFEQFYKKPNWRDDYTRDAILQCMVYGAEEDLRRIARVVRDDDRIFEHTLFSALNMQKFLDKDDWFFVKSPPPSKWTRILRNARAFNLELMRATVAVDQFVRWKAEVTAFLDLIQDDVYITEMFLRSYDFRKDKFGHSLNAGVILSLLAFKRKDNGEAARLLVKHSKEREKALNLVRNISFQGGDVKLDVDGDVVFEMYYIACYEFPIPKSRMHSLFRTVDDVECALRTFFEMSAPRRIDELCTSLDFIPVLDIDNRIEDPDDEVYAAVALKFFPALPLADESKYNVEADILPPSSKYPAHSIVRMYMNGYAKKLSDELLASVDEIKVIDYARIDARFWINYLHKVSAIKIDAHNHLSYCIAADARFARQLYFKHFRYMAAEKIYKARTEQAQVLLDLVSSAVLGAIWMTKPHMYWVKNLFSPFAKRAQALSAFLGFLAVLDNNFAERVDGSPTLVKIFAHLLNAKSYGPPTAKRAFLAHLIALSDEPERTVESVFQHIEIYNFARREMKEDNQEYKPPEPKKMRTKAAAATSGALDNDEHF